MFPLRAALFAGMPVTASVILQWRIVNLFFVERFENS
jgi:hypothetical protein